MSNTGSQSAMKLRTRVRGRDGDSCWVCGQLIDFTITPGKWMGPSLEHVIPVAAGGPRSDLGNLRLSHAYPCNSEKGARHEGTDYSGQPVRRRPNPNAMPARRSCTGLAAFEAWSAARG